jgi:hypothetical protein
VRRGIGHGRGRSGHGNDRGRRIGSDRGDGGGRDRGGANLGRVDDDVGRSCARHHRHGHRDDPAGRLASDDYDIAHHPHEHHPARRRIAAGGDNDHTASSAASCERSTAPGNSAMHGRVHERGDRRNGVERSDRGIVISASDHSVADGRPGYVVRSAGDVGPGSERDGDRRCHRHRGCCQSQ